MSPTIHREQAGTTQLDIVAIVPARGGSKRLPRKNILPLAGKPLIQWTLDAAKASGVISLVVVTTDDDDVLDIADRARVETIRRPDELASDTATTVDTVLHALDTLAEQGITSRRVMLLQPTSPLRRVQDIKAAVERMDATGASSVISVCEMEHPPLWCNTLPRDGSLDEFLKPVMEGRRSQDLPVFYRLNGAIYLVDTNKFHHQKTFGVTPSFSIIMDKKASIDIDDDFDFLVAGAFLSLGVSKDND
ncbi:N-acylneuraminate cytidylyltransferase [Modicisalibacter muralis]|uniref:N-acylneuraminate cytidylyltransferase n=1 Tax=Modicisalibacter muralis TaxID=119000 RepID=A0A1G9KEE7_9GAMM|nr:acylneuraminate cytidylyltransferase family protein [Halomonas muralis]SDL48107.1 N-acylneuraminate cytidylyltransferase [Halomonas muralis]